MMCIRGGGLVKKEKRKGGDGDLIENRGFYVFVCFLCFFNEPLSMLWIHV